MIDPISASLNVAAALIRLAPTPADVQREEARHAAAISNSGALEANTTDLSLDHAGPKVFADIFFSLWNKMWVSGEPDVVKQYRFLGWPPDYGFSWSKGDAEEWLKLANPQAPRTIWPRYKQETKGEWLRRISYPKDAGPRDSDKMHVDGGLGLRGAWKAARDMVPGGDFEGGNHPEIDWMFKDGPDEVPQIWKDYVAAAREQAGLGHLGTFDISLGGNRLRNEIGRAHV